MPVFLERGFPNIIKQMLIEELKISVEEGETFLQNMFVLKFTQLCHILAFCRLSNIIYK